MNKRLFSMFLALCMIVTMLPVSAMAEEIHTTIGGSGEIISFAPLAETEKTVLLGTSIEDLELPETLTATVRTAVSIGEDAVQDSGSPGTATLTTATEPEWVENTVEIPVRWVSPDYDMKAEGVYVFTPVVEGYTVSAPLPEIVVTVGEMPPLAAARGSVAPMSTTNYGIWVGGVQVTSENANSITGTGIDGTVSYDPTNNTLTLNTANITGCYTSNNYDYGIYHSDSSMVNNLIINLVGTNTITLNARGSQTVAGIYSEQSGGSLTFCETGSGSLSISAPNMAIYGENAITISSGTINATGGPVGIYSNGQMTINGGNVTADGTLYGIMCKHSLSITSGTLTATGGTHAIVFTDGSLSASDGMQIMASANKNGTPAVSYDAANLENYKYIKVEPAATPPVLLVADLTALNSAITSATGDLNLKLSDSYSGTGTITIPEAFVYNITIDLNSKTLNGGSAAAITHQGDGTLTITDSSSGGAVTSTTNSQGTIAAVNGGTVELLGGTVSNSNSAGGAAVYTRNATLNIRGGAVSAAGDGGVAVWDSSSSILNIYGGMLSAAGSSGNAVYSTNADSRLNISGGTISAASNIAIYHQNTTIKTGTIIIQGGTKAMQSAPTLESGVQGMASTNIDGSDSVAYNVADLATYKYIKVEPAAVTPVPTVTSVSVPANGTYLSEYNLDFTVTFNEDVTVNTLSGTPYLSLIIGSASRHAAYVSGSVTSNLVFRYTVQAGDSDIDGISISSLTLNGGTIQDSTGNNANLTLNSVGNMTGVLVNPPAPSISSHPSPQTVNEGETTTFSVTATGTGLTYQWQVKTGSSFANITSGGVYSGASTSTLTITGVTAEMNDYQYRVVVTGTYSPIATSTSALLTVTAAPSYTITANPTTKDFGSLSVGYSAPAAQTVTITNTGNSSVTLTQPTSTNYTIGALSTTALAANGTATFTVTPKTGLAVGAHNETLTVSTNHSTSATVALSFAVTAAPTYTITANPTTRDFGSLSVGYSAPAAQTVTITNTGNSSLTLTQPTSTNYTIGALSTTALAANGTATFTVTPKTGLAAGNHNETLTVSTDHSTSATVALSFTVTAAPTYTITADPVTKDFGSLTIGYSAPAAQTVTITNTGNSSLTLTQPTSTNYTIGALSTTALAANGTATFTVTPKTGLAAGNHNETLTVSTNHSTNATVNLSFSVTAVPTYTITANPTTKEFGSLSVGYSAPAAQTVTITNTGNPSVTLTQPTSTNYTIGALSTTTLAANGTAIFTVAPKAGLAVGNYNETLTLSTDHSTNATVELSFSVTAVPDYTVTFNPNGGTVGETTRSVASGTAVGALPTPTRSGSYSFDGWYTATSGGTQISASTTVSANVTYYAHWTYTGGGGSGSGGGSSSNDNSSPVIVTPPAPDKPNSPTQGEIKVPGTVDGNGNITVNITDKAVADAFNKALADAKKNGNEQNGITVVLRVDAGSKTGSNVRVNLPKAVQDTIIKNKVVSTIIVVDNPDIRIGMDLETVQEINSQAKSDVNITATRTDNSELNGGAKDAIGNRPVFDLQVNYGTGRQVQNFGDGSVTVTIPYTLGANEKAENVKAVYIDENGKLYWLENSVYDSVEKVVRFSTNHFSIYAVGYKQTQTESTDTDRDTTVTDTTSADITFTDIAGHWAKADIEYVVRQGLFSGMSTTTFSPNTAMTRGMFVTVLGRLANADVNSHKKSSFTDVPSDAYYMGYLEWASKNSIVKGIGNGEFAPNQSITREQMAVIINNYAKNNGIILPKAHGKNTFADSANISTYAKDAVQQMQMAGVIGGKDRNLFDPQGTATRAEVAAVLRRFMELAISNDAM